VNTEHFGAVALAALTVLVAGVPARAVGAAPLNLLVTHFTVDEGLPDSVIDVIDQTSDGYLWLVTGGKYMIRFDGTTFYRFEPRPVTLTAAPGGDLWMGTSEALLRVPSNNFNQFTLTGLTTYHPGPEKETEVIRLRVGRNGVLWVGTSDGLFRYDGTRFVAFGPRVAVREIEEGPDGHILTVTENGFFEWDGSTMVPNLALTKDGRLWAATTKGLAQFDLARLPVVNTKPSIYITNVTIGRKTARAARDIVLPAGTNHFQVDFSAVEISSPEKIRMQYRLDDVDSEWLDAGRGPHAIYSTLPVGTHLLHIRASNRSGIWDREGVVFSITQLPFFYQTRWFAAMIGGLVILLVVGVFRTRVRQMSRAMSARFDERLAERTRVARELHDTLLQTFHGVLFRFQAAVNMLPEHPAEAKERLESAIDRAAQAITEGRDAIQDLRASTVVTNDLAVAITTLGDELAASGANGRGPVVHVAVQGSPRDLHAILRDDIYRIAGEALRNAFRHAHARRIEVGITYDDRQFRLQVRDDGKGIDPAMLSDQRRGHFGLPGIRERAELVGGRLDVWSEVGVGTEVDLRIPAARAYATARARRRSWWFPVKTSTDS
jgi:signal transduction histidine kinase